MAGRGSGEFVENVGQHLERAIDERLHFVELADVEESSRSARPAEACQIEGDARELDGAALQVATLLEQRRLGARRQRGTRDRQLGEGEIEKHAVEVIAPQAVDAGGGDHFVANAAHAQEGRIEGTASDVVHDDVILPGGQRIAIAMGVLESGRGRLVE